MNNSKVRPAGITVVLGGGAGQGIQYIETILSMVVKECGYYVFATKEYMSRIRGGINTTEIRISDQPVISHVDAVSLLIPLKQGVVEHVSSRLDGETLIIGEGSFVGSAEDRKLFSVPFTDIALEHGNKIYANSVALGVICGVVGLDENVLLECIAKVLANKPEDVVDSNRKAACAGFEEAQSIKPSFAERSMSPIIDAKDPQLLLSGADAVALGSLAGGCDAAFAYPMTPGTSVFTLLANFSQEYDLFVEQVEDEIAAVNMAIGAWYAGGRPLVSTSGGGFALMTEGVSLAGMMESPLVIHLAQRPGPATGLPTRTEQGDLNLVRYAGHGEFSRIILAPGNLEQGFSLSRKAFELAAKYQVPVFILTDQYYVDTIYTTPHFSWDKNVPEDWTVETKVGYQRYRLTDDGISPRGVPGHGNGTVCVDSDEHDEGGRITEDLDGVHMAMADKRMKKHDTVCNAALEPEFYGDSNFSKLIIGWGSTFGAIQEALHLINDPEIGFLFCPQLYPVHPLIKEYLEKSEEIIVVENNQCGQFADLLSFETGVRLDNRILKYNGMPFSVEELVSRISGDM